MTWNHGEPEQEFERKKEMIVQDYLITLDLMGQL